MNQLFKISQISPKQSSEDDVPVVFSPSEQKACQEIFDQISKTFSKLQDSDYFKSRRNKFQTEEGKVLDPEHELASKIKKKVSSKRHSTNIKRKADKINETDQEPHLEMTATSPKTQPEYHYQQQTIESKENDNKASSTENTIKPKPSDGIKNGSFTVSSQHNKYKQSRNRPKASLNDRKSNYKNGTESRKEDIAASNVEKLENRSSSSKPSSANFAQRRKSGQLGNINSKESQPKSQMQRRSNSSHGNKPAVNTEVKTETINVDKVTEVMSGILKDLKKRLNNISKPDVSPTAVAKIEVVSRRFFENKTEQSGKVKSKTNSNKHKSLKNSKRRSNSCGATSRNSSVIQRRTASSRTIDSGVELKRKRSISPSGVDSNSDFRLASGSNRNTPSKGSNMSNQKHSSGNSLGNRSSPSLRGSKTSSSNHSLCAKNSSKTIGKRSNSSVGSAKRPSTDTSSVRNSSSSRYLKSKNILHRAISDIDPLSVIRQQVNAAIRENRTFTVRGRYPAIRNALLKRGWVEKIQFGYRDQLSRDLRRYQMYTIPELIRLMRNKEVSNVCKTLVINKLLEGHQVDFYWSFSNTSFRNNPDTVKLTMINKLRRDIFSYTDKQGLCEAANNSYWYQIPEVSRINHPRSYTLTRNGDTKGFVHDFGITAAMSLLKWIVKSNITKETKLISPTGKIPIQTFDFAVNECCKFIKKAQHADIDEEIKDAFEYEWNQFLDYYYKIVHIGHHFKKTEGYSEESMVKKSVYILDILKEYWPHLNMDGMFNIWILKPTMGCRGKGIHICRTLQYILKVVKANPNLRYVVQKYIEKPLLIYNTKFDIRQWFLISCSKPLTIWIYKECYLRFSSQTYNLRKLHESIHLTNNAVQSKYQSQVHDLSLPPYNMWDLQQFQNYLANIGYPKVFKERIYPGMRQSITAAVLTHQDKIDKRPCCFELYGADFMVTEDFQPWLIEINSCPALYASTPITAKLCPQVLEDVIKVVIDYARNKKANTGKFELIYQEKDFTMPKIRDCNLKLNGIPLSKEYFEKEAEYDKAIFKEATDLSKYTNAQAQLKCIGSEIKTTLENLIQMIQMEKMRRQEFRALKQDIHSSTDTMFTANTNLDQANRTTNDSSHDLFQDAEENLQDVAEYMDFFPSKFDEPSSKQSTAIFMKQIIDILFIKNSFYKKKSFTLDNNYIQ